MKISGFLITAAFVVGGAAAALAFQPPSPSQPKLKTEIEALLGDKAFSISKDTNGVMEMDMRPI